MPTFASPLAFEPCEGSCAAAKIEPDNKHASCPPSDGCQGAGCYCQLFYRTKGAADTEPWHASAINKNKLSSHDPDKFDYKCLCVKPILEGELTVDDVKYSVRYQLCPGGGSCSLDVVEVIGVHKHAEVKCSGTCEGDCKCTLFRLEVGGKGFDPGKAKWARVAKAGDQVKLEPHSLYRCFCLK